MEPRDPYPPDEGATEVVHEDAVVEDAPPPWWREHWWLGPLALLLVVGALLAWAFWPEDGGDRTTVPEVVGLQEPEARARLTEAGLEVQVTRAAAQDEAAAGTVLAQEPGAGSQAEEGQTVLLTVAGATETETETDTEPTQTVTVTDEAETEPPPTQTETETETQTQTETVQEEPEPTDMPGVVGEDYREAARAILDAGLLPQSYPVESRERQATVVAQNPAEGTRLSEGTPVRINVSLGPGGRAEAEIPDLRDLELAEALGRCHDAGFTCRIVERDTSRDASRGRIIGQEPAPGGRAQSLTQLTLAVGR